MVRPLTLCLLLTGCAPMPESECRTSNWYKVGERDAMAGLQPQLDQYADQCGRFAVRPSESDYLTGWNEGNAERNSRMRGRGGM